MDVINRKFPENLGAARSHLDTHATGKEQLPLITPHAHRSTVLPTAPRSPGPRAHPSAAAPKPAEFLWRESWVTSQLVRKGQAAVGVRRLHPPALGTKATFLGEVTSKY